MYEMLKRYYCSGVLLALLFASFSCVYTSKEDLVGYINNKGNYGFNFPSDWEGTESGANVSFYPEEEIKIAITVQPEEPEDSFKEIISGINEYYDSAQIEYSIIDQEQALKIDIVGSDGKINHRIYEVFHDNYLYIISILANPNNPVPSNFDRHLDQFEELVLSFRFLIE